MLRPEVVPDMAASAVAAVEEEAAMEWRRPERWTWRQTVFLVGNVKRVLAVGRRLESGREEAFDATIYSRLVDLAVWALLLRKWWPTLGACAGLDR